MKTKVSRRSDAALLGSLPLLKGLHLAEFEVLADGAVKARLDAGRLLCREGRPARHFYLVLRGKIALEAPQPGSDPICICTLGRGDIVGWSWLLPPYRWHFDARTLTRADVVVFSGTRMLEYCEDHPRFGFLFARRVTEVMLARLQSTRRQLCEISALALRSQWEALHLAAELGMSPRPKKKDLRQSLQPHRPVKD
jgi:CRP-like cAMP-binding protein